MLAIVLCCTPYCFKLSCYCFTLYLLLFYAILVTVLSCLVTILHFTCYCFKLSCSCFTLYLFLSQLSPLHSGHWLLSRSDSSHSCTSSSSFHSEVWQPIWLTLRHMINWNQRTQQCKRKMLCWQKKKKMTEHLNPVGQSEGKKTINILCTFHKHCLFIWLLLSA